MFYKAELFIEPKIKFELSNITDDEAIGKTTGSYMSYHGNERSRYAIRKTKKLAIDAIKLGIQRSINEKEKELAHLKNIVKEIDKY